MPRNEIVGKPDTLGREVAIVNYLREQAQGATASDIYAEVSGSLGDTISRPAYYKILERLVAAGKLDQMEDQGVRRYRLAPQLHATNRLTLDDVYEMLPFVESTQTVAQAIEAQEYFLEHRQTILRRTAQALTQEPAVDLFYTWIGDLIDLLEKDLQMYFSVEEEGVHVGEKALADGGLETRIASQCETLREILYRHLSIPLEVIELPEWEGLHGLRKKAGSFHCDRENLKETLAKRVFGVGETGTFLGAVVIDPETIHAASQEMIISGSDGSFHAGTVGLRTAQGYIEDDSFVLTFNNSVAYVRSSKRLEQQKGAKKYLHSAPLTRQTLDDPAYKGMVLAPFMFPTLTDSEYEHMTRTATDVVQMRVDDEVFNGKARDVATGEQIMPPRVHIRDGTITPQERGFNHYILMNPYGDIAREGIARGRSILQRIRASNNPPVYAGAVKSTQLRLFSRLINWYISRGSRLTQGNAIEPNWDSSRAGYISDIDVMTILLASPNLTPGKDRFWVSCVVIRQFSALTDFFDTKLGERTWFDFLRTKRQRALEDYEQYRGELPYHALLSEDDLADDAYLYMLNNADYAAFYVGHTWGEPPPKVPRYEFLCSLRSATALQAKQHVDRTVQLMATALVTCQFSQDRDHNFLSHLSLVKLVPSVVYHAHEAAKQLGKKLESEFKSIVVKRLAERRKRQIQDGDVDIRPVGVRAYLQRFANARKALPPPQRDNEER